MFEEGATDAKPEKVDVLKEFGVEIDSEPTQTVSQKF